MKEEKMRLTKKELDKLQRQTVATPRRDATWVGIRPVVITPKKLKKKLVRREGKRICREYA